MIKLNCKNNLLLPGNVFIPADVKIHLKNSNQPLLFRTSLKALEPELPSLKFIRIHKSYIVAIEGITAIRKAGLFINDMELPIGETFRDAVEQLVKRKF
jgi:DNA-binding LytR/AlgR family response regulator